MNKRIFSVSLVAAFATLAAAPAVDAQAPQEPDDGLLEWRAPAGPTAGARQNARRSLMPGTGEEQDAEQADGSPNVVQGPAGVGCCPD